MGNSKNIIGQRFGRLVVLSRAENSKFSAAQWNCKCDCGNHKVAVYSCLASGSTKSCGCYRREVSSSRMAKDLTGKRVGMLTVVALDPNSKGRKNSRWLCRCDCGNEKVVDTPSLRGGTTKSCGCRLEATGLFKFKHGETESPEYRSWSHMIWRCTNSNADSYKYYGGRGITVCATWAKSFETFLQDMGRRPSLNHSIDRIDPDGNYEPSNCRWATQLEQMNNIRSNHRLSKDTHPSR